MNEPTKHHYVPVFYLKRWVGPDGCICRFTRPYGTKVVPKRVSPAATGYQIRLYEAHGVPPEMAQSMERDFLAKLDSDAATALDALESNNRSLWTETVRIGWSRFLLAQMLRSPRDIKQIKDSVGAEWDAALPELREKYREIRSEDAPVAFEQFLETVRPGHADELAFNIARTLMSHTKIIDEFSAMIWDVWEFSDETYPLLTSDQPVWMTATITEPDAFITVPIGPRKLFSACVNPKVSERLRRRNRRELTKAINEIQAFHAMDYVYAIDDKMQRFIENRMSQRQHSTLLERLAEFRQQNRAGS